jgi:hypothetical protein
MKRLIGTLALATMAIVSGTAGAQDSTTPTKPPATAATAPPPEPAGDAQELAKKLSNPIAALISVPFQSNFDFNIGPGDDGWKYQLNIQPVVPISISEDWNVISRTILPLVSQYDIFPGAGDQFGLGDITQSFFFSPKAPSAFGRLIWGVGPAMLIPTATDDLLGTEKFGIGPTAVVLKQDGPWTLGMLANQIWSVAGDSDREDISNLFLQPFVSYTTKDAWTFALNTESNYNWKDEEWSVPINLQVTKIVKIGPLPVSLGAGVRYWAVSPDSGPEGVGVRTIVTFLFPK